MVLLDAKRYGGRAYLSSDRLGREVWCTERQNAKRFPTLAEAQRAALLARRRPGRSQPYAIPAAASEH